MIKINGKDYVTVHERVLIFRKKYPEWTLDINIIELNKEIATLQAIIRDENGKIRASGLAHEISGSSNVNKRSHVENAETSAWGRALANLGIGIETSISSAEEIEAVVDPLESMPPDLKNYYQNKKMKKGEVRKECKHFGYDWDMIRDLIKTIEEDDSKVFEENKNLPSIHNEKKELPTIIKEEFKGENEKTNQKEKSNSFDNLIDPEV